MSKIADDLNAFIEYWKILDGDEKGEAQVFCERLFQAFGHKGYKEAGATLEYRIKKRSTKGTSFADLIWKPRLLIEMKKRGEKLYLHYGQAFDYWINAVPNRPRYVVLCNFDEFWIYDFDKQLDDPIDKVLTTELPKRYTALNFLFPDEREPIFGNDREAVSRKAARQIAELFLRLTRRPGKPVPHDQAQRFVLQIVIAMFAEDIDLLPAGTVSRIATDCLEHGQSSYDLFGEMFRQMNDPKPAGGGRFEGVPYFNGGLFSTNEPIELTKFELDLIGGPNGAASQDWSKINPAIFGTLFQQSMGEKVQHRHGRHFTSEADIQRIIKPTIARPWREKIDQASTMNELLGLRGELANFRVLDPACGSGNFLYVAFRELTRLDLRLMTRLQMNFSHKEFEQQARVLCVVTPKQFFGIDNDTFGVELTKVTLMLAKKLALDEAVETFAKSEVEYGKGTAELSFREENALPLDDLDSNIVCDDALFCDWPEVDAIIGNPPYQSKNKIQEEMGRAYINRLRERHSEIDGRADYCAYWFRLAHDHLKLGQRAGLVGTNTIRQNYSREGSLDYIVANDGTITEAVSSMIWPGKAVVHVSIVNWIKNDEKGVKRLYIQDGNLLDAGWRNKDLEQIGPSLSFELDVTKAKRIEANAKKGGCYQGQTHGHKTFLMKPNEAKLLVAKEPRYAGVVKPFLIANDLVGQINSRPTRYVIDFSGLDLLEAKDFSSVFDRVEKRVLPAREKAAKKEEERNREALEDNPTARVNQHHANFLKKWWQMSYPRKDMMSALKKLDRYIVCGRVTKRPIFDFVSQDINPNDALQVFPYDDDYSFGVLQSGIHWVWFIERCSTLKADPRYTSNTVFDSYPWPQNPTLAAVKMVAQTAVSLREKRRALGEKHNLCFRDLYRSLENPGDHPLKEAHAALDEAVSAAYGIKKDEDPLAFLLNLNHKLSDAEANEKAVQEPGLPEFVSDRKSFITGDCIEP